MMDGDNGETRTARRPQTPHDFSRLESIGLDNALSNGSPSHATESEVSQPSFTNTEHSTSTPARRPQTPPTLGAPHLTTEFKRDSGVSPPSSTGERASSTAADDHGLVSTPQRPPVPTILVEDQTPPPSGGPKSPFGRKRKTRYGGNVLQPGQTGHSRIRSFHGISMEIPAGELEDLKSPDKVKFSNRGSMFIGGEKVTKATPSGGAAAQDQSPQTPPQGLSSGARKPSVHMLQAATNGGRVLSAEEVTFSIRVRSMYEHGSEDAADWQSPTGAEAPRAMSTASEEDSDDSDMEMPVSNGDTLHVNKTRNGDTNGHLRPFSPMSQRTSSTYKDPNEIAGGIEDWEDVEGRDVDRYGFISPNRVASRGSSNESGQSPHRPAIQRVSTSLQLIADSPRRRRTIRRMPSNARSTRSVQRNGAKDAQSLRTKASLHSVRSTTPSILSATPFRSRNRRLIDEASDMLTLPPGLADIEEQEDGGRTANLLKRREWAREEKWRKMARLVPSSQKGAGMTFDFDTQNARLIARTWKGIPDRWRATAWHSFLLASAKRRGSGNYETDDELIAKFHEYQSASSADDVQIDVDVPRTINLHIMFRRRYRGGQRLLFRILHAISLHSPEVGYVQGMASLAATLLCYYDEEHAFVMLVRLWKLRGLETLFSPGFDGLMATLDAFEKDWLDASADNGPVAAKLTELGISSTAYGTRWYLTLFNMSIPFPAQLRVWDVFMLLGDESPSSTSSSTTIPPPSPSDSTKDQEQVQQDQTKPENKKLPPDFAGANLDVLHATSAALVDATREIILDSDFENAMKVLTSWVPVKDEDLLMRVAKAEWKAKKKRDR